MAKPGAAKAARSNPPPRDTGKTRNPFALNAQFNQQTRKLLNKHYRAKHGVK
jgi:hypothetical protein